jgi:hypothetical protein
VKTAFDNNPHELYAHCAAILRHSILVINGLEGLDNGDHTIVSAQLDVFRQFKNTLGVLYSTNESLRKFDPVFDSAGWYRHGLRWTAERKGEDEDIFVVEFKNEKRTRWKIP